MANITAVFGILLTLGIALPGLLTAWWLLFPATVERARLRLDRTPWRCFWLGGVMTALRRGGVDDGGPRRGGPRREDGRPAGLAFKR